MICVTDANFLKISVILSDVYYKIFFIFVAYKAFSGANFTYNYTAPASNINRNFSVINTVEAPALAEAMNENQDNDQISNTATNVGGRRKRKKRSSREMSFTSLVRAFFGQLSTLCIYLYQGEEYLQSKILNHFEKR